MKKLFLLLTTSVLAFGSYAQDSEGPTTGPKWQITINCTEPAEIAGETIVDMVNTGEKYGDFDIYSGTFIIDEVTAAKPGKFWLSIADASVEDFTPIKFGSNGVYYVNPNTGSRTIIASLYTNTKGNQVIWSLTPYGLADANRRALAYFPVENEASVRSTYFNNARNNAQFKGMQGENKCTVNYVVGSNNDMFAVSPTDKNWAIGVYKATLDYTNMKYTVEAASAIDVDIDGFTTFVAPAAITIPAGVTAYTLAYDTTVENNTVLDATKIEGTTLAANTPVLLKASTPGTYSMEFAAETPEFSYDTDGDPTTSTPVYIKDVTSENNVLTGVMQPHYIPDGTAEDGSDVIHFLDSGKFNIWNSANSTDGKGKVVNHRIIYPFEAYVQLPVVKDSEDNVVAKPEVLTVKFPDDTISGISNVEEDQNRTVQTYNIFGMPVDENYKGIVIRNGKKYIQK